MKRFGLATLAAIAMMQTVNAQNAAVQRGDYLVNTILTCGNCHTPKGPSGDIAERAFSGGLEFDEPPFKVTAPNITPDPGTGIGKWSNADIKKLLLTGVRPNGVQIAAVMPTGFYNILTPRDLDAIVAYLRTLKPIKNTVPDPIYKIALKPQIFPGAEKPIAASALNDKVKKGFYLATIGHCMECHTPLGPRGRDFVGELGKSGFELKGPWGVSVARNITTSKTKGIGAWSDDEIKRAITQGISRDGSKLKPPMGYHYYAKMTASDLDAIVAYLRTVPAKD
ncbi:MAG: cytochrome c [Rhizobiales bacterium]|nr:cytochrome c [Hyphomicrobiales bacterium]